MRRCSLVQNRSHLEVLAALLIDRVQAVDPAIEEGVVMTLEKTPYRRLDFGGRALCYIRVRPTKKCVRVDLAKPFEEFFAIASEEEIEGAVRRLVARARR
jgi:hypothetical protein